MSKLDEVSSIFREHNYFAEQDYVVLNLSAIFFRKEAISPGFKNHIIALVQKIAESTNVIVPGFTFFKRDDRRFSVLDTLPTLGWFNSLIFDILKSQDVPCSRTNSCTHSFFILGRDALLISEKTVPETAFGDKSIFDYLESHIGLWVNIGCEPNQGFSLIHRVEHLLAVPYRELITFNVKYTDKHSSTTQVEYEYMTRQKAYDTHQCFEKLLQNARFKANNLSKLEYEHVSIHRYSELTACLCEIIDKNKFYFIRHSE